MAVATKTTPLPKAVTTPGFLEKDQVVGVTTRNSYELGTVIASTGAYLAYRTGETDVAVPWAHIVKVESR